MSWVTAAAIVGALAAVAGTAVSASASQSAGRAQKRNADFNAQVAEQGAVTAAQQAQYDADRIRERNTRLFHQQRASSLKSGVTISGSINDVLYDSAIEGEKDALASIYKGGVASYNSRNTAISYRAAGAAASSQANYNSAGTILSGLGSVAGAASKIEFD